jgi:hypothetical protein
MVDDCIEEKIRSILVAHMWAPGAVHVRKQEEIVTRLIRASEEKDSPLPNVKTKKAAEKYLHTLGNAAQRLSKHLNEIPVEVSLALALNHEERTRLLELLRDVGSRIEVALENLPEPRGKAGPKQNRRVLQVALSASAAWFYVTSKRATPGTKDRTSDERSDFEKFLAEIFCALGIDASPEHYAKRARRILKALQMKRLRGNELKQKLEALIS